MTDTLDAGAAERVDRHMGARIRHRRRERGISQSKLAETLGVSFQQVQKYETGANRVSASTLWRISQALAVEPGYWFDGLPTDHGEALRYNQAAQLLLTDDGQALAGAYAEIRTRSARIALISIARELAAHARDLRAASGLDPLSIEAPEDREGVDRTGVAAIRVKTPSIR